MLSNLKDIGLVRSKHVENKPFVSVVITGDAGDADYVTNDTLFYEKSMYFLKELIDLIKDEADLQLIKSKGFARGEYKKVLKAHPETTQAHLEYLRNCLMELVDLPFSYDDICHTITDIKFLYTETDGSTFELEIVDNTQ